MMMLILRLCQERLGTFNELLGLAKDLGEDHNRYKGEYLIGC